MAKARSPQYPSISLKEAIEKIGEVYKNDYQNPISREVAGAHMGYKSLHGNALGVLSALVKYGLLEGRGDNTRVSDWAVRIVAHEPGAPERVETIKLAAARPKLFAELDTRFPGGKASDQNIRSYLLTQKYIPSAADAAIRAYRETKQLVEAETAGYSEGQGQEPAMNASPAARLQGEEALSPAARRVLDTPGAAVRMPAMMQEKFDLDEGPVTFNVPAVLSPESYQDMADRIEIFLRGFKRRSDAEAARRRQDREDIPE